MQANLIAAIILATIAGAAFLRADPARCEVCFTGSICYGDAGCGGGCRCQLPNGIGKPGFCG